MFIADYHSLTVSPKPEDLRERVKRVALDYLACGLDPQKSCFFRQSDVPEVCELTWILNCVTGTGLLERAHSYKDKVAKGFAPNNGLFSYPVLMTLYALEVHGPMTQKGLADRYGFPKQTIHGVVHGLVKDGTVALLPSETDRREKLVTLTGPGRELVRTRLAPLFDAEREALSVIGQERIDRMLDTIGLFNLLMGRNLQEA